MKIILFFMLFSISVLAEEKSKTNIDASEDIYFNSRKNHWVTTFGFEGMAYSLPFNYVGIKESFKEEDRTLMGARLGIGREYYLGAGFLLGARLDGYYLGTLFTKEKTAGSPYPSTSFKTTKDSGSFYGGDAVLHFGWMFDYKTKTLFLREMVHMAMEFFVEGSLGQAQAWNKKRYYYGATTQEGYQHTFADNLTTSSFGGGINFLSRASGFFLSLKASTLTVDLTERKFRKNVIVNGAYDLGASTSGTIKDVDMKPITVYTLGAGYKF